ncbi:MAG: hypothetical protein GY952_20250 [Rhodobacteraceae bacterium]|nr:hypothetical protein [Paracoccaceae bacterium]
MYLEMQEEGCDYVDGNNFAGVHRRLKDRKCGVLLGGSLVGAGQLIEALTGFFTIEQHDDMVERIEQIEVNLQRMNDYWNSKKT